MYPSFFDRLLKLKHYGKSKGLRIVSGIQFFISFVLVFLPLYLNHLLKFLQSQFGLTFNNNNISNLTIAWLIAILSGINILRECLLSKNEIVNIDFDKRIIRHLIMLLTDTYGFKGTCRATLFVPSPKDDKIIVYDRISTGRSPGYGGRCFFSMGQGLPGMAWKNAWSGENTQDLVEALHIGNVPNTILGTKNKLREFFKSKFNILDDDIYNCLGETKSKIKSYMAVGILGRYKKLACVLIIDSEDENKFADFEQLKKKRTGTLHQELSIVGRSHSQNKKKNETIKKKPEKINEGENIKEIFQKQVEGILQESPIPWNDKEEMIKEMNFLFHAEHLKTFEPNIEGFLYPLNWALKQIKDILSMEL